MPENIRTRSFIVDDYVIAIGLVGYLIGLIIVGTTYLLFAHVFNGKDIISNLIYAVGWPLVTYGGLGMLVGGFRGDTDQLQYFQYIPILIFVHILALILTILCSYYIILRKRSNIISDPNKGIKLSFDDFKLKTNQKYE